MKTKKIISIVLVLAVMVGTFTTMFSLSASAVLNEDGTYAPSEGVKFYTYFFAMPDTYTNGDYLSRANIFWDEGTDACGLDIWPGYLAYTNKYTIDVPLDPNYHRPHERDLYYAYVPQDVPSIIWNNYPVYPNYYEHDNENTEVAVSSTIFETTKINVGAENGYHEGDGTYYDSLDGFWNFVNDAWKNNKDQLGDNTECFAEGSNGLAITFNNMVYVIDDSEKTATPSNGESLRGGEWYFLYNNDYYGSWPTAEMAQEQAAKGNGVYNDIYDAIYRNSVPKPEPDPKPDPTEEPTQEPTADPTTQPPTTDPTNPTTAPTKTPTQAPTNNHSSSDSQAVTTNNSAVQTGYAAYAGTLLILLVAVASVVLFIRKKKTD